MGKVSSGLACVLFCGSVLLGDSDPLEQLEKIRANASAHLDKLELCVCQQTVERFQRSASDQPWKPNDKLKLDVALTDQKELYGKAGAAKFFRGGLNETVGGVTSTGRYGLILRQVLDPKTTAYKPKGEAERNGRKALEFDFEVLEKVSTYRLKAGTADSAVGYEGTFWVDAESLDLIRLEAHAIDIPKEVGLAEARFHVEYGYTERGGERWFVPLRSQVELATTDGLESLNRTKLGECRNYQAESSIAYAGEASPTVAPQAAPKRKLPAGALLELTLEEAVSLESAAVGHPVKARLTRALQDGDVIVLQQGALVEGHIVTVERQTLPMPLVEVGLAFSRVVSEDGPMALAATMVDADKTKGLLQQQKRLMPQMSQSGKTSAGILVRRVEEGQGVLQWDPKQTSIPRGFKTRWRVTDY